MPKEKTILLPSQERIISKLGENIKYARLRRDLSSEMVSERAGIARSSLLKIEKGDPAVSIGMYMKVLFVLGLEDDLKKVAEDDLMGRRLQDAKLTTAKRASKK